MTETMTALRDLENKLDEMDEAMAAMKLIFESSLSSDTGKKDDKGK